MPFKKGETPKGAKPFSKDYQPKKNGRPEGSKSRSTILKKWLLAELDIVNPITKDKQRGTVEDEVMLALITKARKGDVTAIKEVLDTMYGKLTDKVQIDANQLDTDIERELALLAAGGEADPSGEAEGETIN
jgi:hypothetical protein